ncbi:fibronectin type III domain-containing protein [Fodinicola acaciae]|uniref:fibronectin type III domain-containing protein n=1 Tax=Fodinicola acaciae TaxID=2681555 RepID=UPI0013D11A69|nr:fibronectin type III domain-containing protein [Fodinicola acaciae]
MTDSPGRPAGPLAALRGRLSGSGGFASVGVVAVLLGSMLATVFGAGAASRVLNISDGNVWLWSAKKGEVGRVNTASGKVDQRVPLSDAQGHRVEVTQTDQHVLVRDLDTGQITSLDLNQLGHTATAKGPQGQGVRVVLAGDTGYLVNNLSGQVQQINPTTLARIGAPQTFAAPLSGGVADQTGRVWFAVPSQGTVVAVGSSGGDTDQRAAQAANSAPGAQVLATAKVAPPNHELAMTALRSGSAIIDTTDGRVSTVIGSKVASVVATSIRGPVLVPDHTDGVIPVTQPGSRTVFLVNGTSFDKVQVPGAGRALGAAVVFGGRVYVADNTSHAVQIFGLTGQPEQPISIPDANGPIELEVREDHLVINAPSSPHAVVVDGQGNKLDVDKYPPDVPGATDEGEGQAPPTSTPNPTGEQGNNGAPSQGNGGQPGNNGNGGQNTPALTAPGSVSGLQASAGNKSVQLSWRRPSSGGAVNSYVITAEGRSSVVVPASRRSATIDGLTNGVEYRFSVTARNRVGSGPATLANPVTPTGDVPGIPTNVTATPQKDGSVQVRWKDPLDQGPGITGHKITATGPNGTQDFDGGVESTYTVQPNNLNYGDSYTFTVTANGLVTSGQPSQPSAAVAPYTVPDKPTVEVKNTTATSVTFKWGTPKDNGKALQPYKAVINGHEQDIAADQTEFPVTGLQPGAQVKFSLTAVNAAGSSDTAEIDTKADDPEPTIDVTDKISDSYTKATVKFTVDWHGGPAGTCDITIDGKSAGTSCTSGSVKVDKASTNYDFTITAKSTTGRTGKVTDKAKSKVFTVTNSCDYSPDNDCSLGVYKTPPDSDPNLGPRTPTRFPKHASKDAMCYSTGYRSQTGNQVDEYKNLNGGKGRQSNIWVWTELDGYSVGAYMDQSDSELNNLPKC